MLIDAKAFYDYDQRESGNLLESEDHEDFWLITIYLYIYIGLIYIYN